MRACLKSDVFDAFQFIFKDGIDGPETCAVAKSSGLSTNGGISKLWEVETTSGWKIVNHGDWILSRGGVVYKVVKNSDVCTF